MSQSVLGTAQIHQVPGELEIMAKTLENIEETISNLEFRLEPILLPESIKATSPNPQETQLVPTAEAVRVRRQRIEKANTILQGFLVRLEI